MTIQRLNCHFQKKKIRRQFSRTPRVGIDNHHAARTFGRLLDRDCLVKPLPLVEDGDLIALVQNMIRIRGRETVRVSEVTGHATDADVRAC